MPLRFIRHNRHVKACAIRAFLNAKIWQCNGSPSGHTIVGTDGLYNTLKKVWRVTEPNGGATVSSLWRACRIPGWPRVYNANIVILKRILREGDAAIVTVTACIGPNPGEGHAMFVYRLTKTRLYGTGFYRNCLFDTQKQFSKKWYITSIFRVPAP